MESRGHWSSRVGFVLAAAGSAIGLGNLWKFPYITWDNSGGAFVLIYLACIAAVGLPIMVCELMIGRMTQKSPVEALREAAGPAWAWIGGAGVMTGFIILGYYIVIAGWTLRYVWQCLVWTINGFDPVQAGGDKFAGEFLTNGPLQILLTISFMALTMAVVSRGIGGGIEKAARILMPILLAILALLVVSALTMEGAGEALGFLFTPNFAEVESIAVLEALGHSFFTLSLGMGAMITYGSYLTRNDSVVRSASTVAILDTVIALVACVIMFSVIFSVPEIKEGLSGSKSPVGMLFVTLPTLFYQQVPFGNVLAPLFYLLVAFAALTSTISMLEVVVAYFIDNKGMNRIKATVVGGSGALLISLACAVSLGAMNLPSQVTLPLLAPGKSGVLGVLDHVASNWLLPVGGFFITLAAGWAISRKVSEAELIDENTPGWFKYGVWSFFVRFICPIAVGAIIVAVIVGKDFS